MSNPYLSVNYNPWNEVYGAAANALPRFNDDLLVKFREEKIKQVPEFLSVVFKEAVKLFAEYGYTVECLGYSELNPEERAAYTADRGLTKAQVDIQKSNYRLVRFDFKFMEEIFPVYVHIPYLDQAALVEQDTHYYPLLPIVEKGIAVLKDYGIPFEAHVYSAHEPPSSVRSLLSRVRSAALVSSLPLPARPLTWVAFWPPTPPCPSSACPSKHP